MRTPTAKKMPSGRWRCQVLIEGRRISVTADTKKECERKALTLKYDSANRAALRAADGILLREAVNDYIEARSNVLSPSTIRGYEYIRDNRFQAVMDLPIRYVSSWQAVINAEAKAVAPKTLYNAWGFIRAVLTDAGYDPGNVRLPAVIPSERPFLDPDQVRLFVKAIKGDKYELAYLLALHGLRRSEILALNAEDVTDSIRVNKSRVAGPNHKFTTKAATKTATSTRTVPVVIPRLNTLVKGKSGPLVTAMPHNMNIHLKAICKKENLPEVTFHCLRHTFASLCYHLHIPELQCMELGGWSDLSTMRKIYTHIADADRQKAAKDLTDFFV